MDNLTDSDGTHGAEGARQDSTSNAPDPEVVVKPQRRRFTAEYKERILEEVDACKCQGRNEMPQDRRSKVGSPAI